MIWDWIFHLSDLINGYPERVSDKKIIYYIDKWEKASLLQKQRFSAHMLIWGDHALKEVHLSNIQSDSQVSNVVARSYADMPTPFPPIILNEGLGVLKGRHRIAAAFMRGDATIQAYVPVNASSRIRGKIIVG